ncbi:helix-turn-helix domain-containing protein [Defluviitoga tunisiensis]|jgi:probable regulatory domain-containing protein|uniref:Circadian clock protein n=1 Tax=Defluviitoga tunisiensis TaxID=1006576 RepID=A0A0C7NTC3_DEFTU|nr:helix-turn-helix domain-containing protein [Defluviitoga tunisiensis]CEP79017.1 circadian clock protein [Defluviitoga tunisiensis]HHV01159.1 hypothetical protein [Defluviitoga tunisiensis]
MVKEEEIINISPEEKVQKVFLKAIELVGGLKQLCEYRSLTWLPALARAAFAVVLKEEYHKTDEEIAKELGITKQTVRNILQADPEYAKERISKLKDFMEEEGKNLKGHTAGSIIKLAYSMLEKNE